MKETKANEPRVVEAVEKAVEDCIENGILSGFLAKNRAEAIAVSIFEYASCQTVTIGSSCTGNICQNRSSFFGACSFLQACYNTLYNSKLIGII
mgnify:CR=1 FL=1